MSRRNFVHGQVSLIFSVLIVAASVAAEVKEYRAAINSITSAELKAHVDVLADDTFEGREAGSRGGRAAGTYLVKQFQRHGLRPAGSNGGYFQLFGHGYRNILGLLEGSDPQLKKEVIIIGGHYDHVGYGSRSNSFGPTGYIHNGADDNASGTAAILETIEAFKQLSNAPKRSILFALWDGEEKGLLGSKHWVAQPTIGLGDVKFAINVDMIGRLRKQRLEVYGSRTSTGLRRLISQHNHDVGLNLNFTWELKNNSDHYSFFSRNIPVLMLHTGLHDDYHRPSDDAHKINADGIQDVARVLFQITNDLAERPVVNGFRTASRYESPVQQKSFEAPLPPHAPRFGAWMKPAADNQVGVVLTQVQPGSAADRAGVRAGDRVVRFADEDVENKDQLVRAILQARASVEIVVERQDEEKPLTISVELSGNPVRLGIAWREDPAEPGTVMLTQIVPGSPAHQAGMQVRDRIYAVSGRQFRNGAELLELVTTLPGPLETLIERRGRLQTVQLDVPEVKANETAAASD